MAVAKFELPDGRIARFEIPDEAKEEFGQRLQREVDSIPRQLGLTARAGIEGAADFAGIFTAPIANIMEKATGQQVMRTGDLGTMAADKLGLPSPETGIERIAGEGAKFMVPVGGMAAAASKAAPVVGKVAGNVMQSIAKSPASQLAGAGGGGAASQYVEETGGGPGAQFTAALAGGFAGAATPAIANKIRVGVSSLANSIKGTKTSIDNINAQLDRILNSAGLKPTDIRQSTRGTILQELKKSSDTGKPINQDAIRRLAEFDLVPGATPTRGSITLDPSQITRERNLLKAAANTSDERLNQLAAIPRQNDVALMSSLDEMGASRAVEPVSAGSAIKASLAKMDAPKKAAVDAAYKAVRDSSGRYASLDTPTFSRLANNALDEEMLGTALPESAKTLLNNVSSGKIPLNVNTVVQLDKRLSGISADLMRTGNREGALAVRKVREALFNTPVENTAGQEALSSYEAARQLARQRFQWIDSNPALKAALDDVEPDQFISKFILNRSANVREVKNLADTLREDPKAFMMAKDQILGYLKTKATSGNADEVANFSPAGYNRALNSIGESKLRQFFSDDEMKHLKGIGKVASYLKFQPTGSAVNNSNTASSLFGLLDSISNSAVINRIPFGRQIVAEPLANWSASRGASQALRPELLGPAQKQLGYSPVPVALPAIAATENN